MRYTDWVERVLAIVLDHPRSAMMFGVRHIAEAFGQGLSPEIERAITYALLDLQDLGLIEVQSQSHTWYLDAARPYRTRSLKMLWPEFRSRVEMDADEAAYLRALAAASEMDHGTFAEPRRVRTGEVWDALGWAWDADRSRRIGNPLKRAGYVDRIVIASDDSQRITYVGLAVLDDTVGEALFEARLHLRNGHLRAAGAVAGVLVERRLKELVAASPRAKLTSGKPTIETYAGALLSGQDIEKGDKKRLDVIGEKRNLCVHPYDREPDQDDINVLLESADWFLRSFPPPTPE